MHLQSLKKAPIAIFDNNSILTSSNINNGEGGKMHYHGLHVVFFANTMPSLAMSLTYPSKAETTLLLPRNGKTEPSASWYDDTGYAEFVLHLWTASLSSK